MGGRTLHFLEGEVRVNPLFTLNYLAINDGYDGQWVTAEIVLNGLDRIFRILNLAKQGFHGR